MSAFTGRVIGLCFAALWLSVGAGALLLPPGGRAMQAVAGLGSAAALAWFAGTGART